MTRGVLYLVWGERAKARARQSIDSLKLSNPDLPFTVVELPENSTLYDKSAMFDRSPYESTVYLDADTTVLGKLDFGFEKSERFGMACCVCEVPWARRWECCRGDMVEYNAGIVFFTRQHAEMFHSWRRMCADAAGLTYYRGDGTIEYHHNDQPLLAKAIEREGVNPFVLPLNWNYRPQFQKEIWGPIVIWHDWTHPAQCCHDFSQAQASSRAIGRAVMQ